MSRLKPKESTVKKLFALSGNLCAFPECTDKLVDEGGNLIAQICHIEAAEEGGERYNPNQSDEERRDFSNLVIMCANHHLKTNDVEKYTVKILKNIKREHEHKFLNDQFDVDDSIVRRALSQFVTYNNIGSGVQINQTINEQHNYYDDQAKKDEKDFNIVTEIFDYIFKKGNLMVDVEEIQTNNDFTNIKEKVSLNFTDENHDTIKTMLLNCWKQKEEVQSYIESEIGDGNVRFYALIEDIQSKFRQKKECLSNNEEIEYPKIIEDIAKDYVPENSRNNPDYLAVAKAIVLYFFEYCYIGKKTKEENNNPTLF